ncbi:MAG: anthranilate synthase component I family protein [bacterium]
MDGVTPSFDDFKKCAQRGNAVPVWTPLPRGLTPSDAYARLRGGSHSFLLESGRYHPRIGRFSFCGASPWMVFTGRGPRVEIRTGTETRVLEGDPLEELRSHFNRWKCSPQAEKRPTDPLAAFAGGAVGFISYEARMLFEKLPCANPDDVGTPDFLFCFFDDFAAFDMKTGSAFAVAVARLGEETNIPDAYGRALGRLDALASKLRAPPAAAPGAGRAGLLSPIESNFTQKEYEDIVRRAKKYIAAGDIYQANLSQRLSVTTDVPAFDLYRTLLKINPSPFGGCLEFDGFDVVSSSPERLVWTAGGTVETRPIAGTRPRGKDPREDVALSAELILNEKERAEHIMLVDLERNDLGRVCAYGTVRVDELMALEKYSHVIHIVSNVTGTLEKGRDRFDVIRACFPGGTITGVPKVRCMEIIDELENLRRGLYTGSIGYLSYNGAMDLNIVIRTFVIKDRRAHVQVGAGIVADSDPEREYHETMHKAEALLKTLEKVSAGADARAAER